MARFIADQRRLAAQAYEAFLGRPVRAAAPASAG